MKDIITYQESPIPIPHPDEAWGDMRDRLREGAPAPIPVPPISIAPIPAPAPIASPVPTPSRFPRRASPGRITTTILLLLLTFLNPFRLHTPLNTPFHTPTNGRASMAISRTIPSSPLLATTRSGPGSPVSSVTPLHRRPHIPSQSAASPSTPITAPPTPQVPALPSPQPSLRQSPLPPLATICPKQPHTPSAPALAAKASTTHIDNNYFLLQLGIQWTAQVPTGDPHTYFDGPNGRAQFYRPLLPAAWMQLQWDRYLVEFSFDPFYSNVVPIRPYRRKQFFDTISTTAVNNLQSVALSKLFGFAAGAGYSVQVGGKWWAGGGVQTIWWSQAIVTTYTLKLEQPVGSTSYHPKFQTSNYTSTLPAGDRSLFSTFQLDLYGQLLYNTPVGRAGFRAGIPFSVLSRDQGPTKPLRLEFFYRLPLLTRQVRAAAPPQE